MSAIDKSQGIDGIMASGCSECGSADAVRVGERWLCVDCYSAAGSCCAGEFVPEGEKGSAVQDKPGGVQEE